MSDIAIDPNTRIQVIDEINHLAGARKHQFAAFVRSEACLVVWSDEVDTVIESAEALELRMIQYVWASTKHNDDVARAKAPLAVIGEEGGDSSFDLQSFAQASNVGTTGTSEKGAGYDVMTTEDQVGMGGWTELTRKRRPVYLFAPLITGLAIMVNCVFVGSGIRALPSLLLFFSPASSKTDFWVGFLRIHCGFRTTGHGVSSRRSVCPICPSHYDTVHLPPGHGAFYPPFLVHCLTFY